MNALVSLTYFTPELILVGAAFLILFIDLLRVDQKITGLMTVFFIVCAAVSLRFPEQPVRLFQGFFLIDGFSCLLQLLTLIITGLVVLSAIQSGLIPKKQKGEFYALMLGVAFLLIVMGSVTNLLMIFLAIESVSITSYILTGFQKFNKRASEASLKYLLFSSVSSAVMLFGMSLLFGLTGTLELTRMAAVLQTTNGTGLSLGMVSLVFILVGIGFKIAAVPFHMWAPDVYEGAPTPVAAFLTVGPKSLGFLIALRVLFTAFPAFQVNWGHILVILSILTMTVGNLTAISQSSIKRLLAYSSVAQAGYILMGLAVANQTGMEATFIYLTAYIFTNLGAFLTVSIIEESEKSGQIEAYNGLAGRNPFLAFSLTVFLLSLAGIPPLAGFIGKWYIFSGAIEGRSFGLAIAAALNSAVAVFYYFKVVKAMYFTPAEKRLPVSKNGFAFLAVLIALVGTIAIGLYPAPVIDFIHQAVISFQMA